MQFPVPQFTDVEDKIIGPFTIRQFVIVGGAAIIVFLSYSVTKNIFVLIMSGVIFGTPALFIAFYKHSGMPLYKVMPQIIRHFMSPKVYVFHKEAQFMTHASTVKSVQKTDEKPKELTDTERRDRLKDINLFLQRKALEEEVVAKNPEQFQTKQTKLSDIFK